MRNSNYYKYKALKEQFAFSYLGVKFDELLSIPIWSWANSRDNDTRMLKGFVKALDYRFLKDVKKDRLLFTSVPRQDHSNTFDSIAEKVKDQYDTINKKQGIEPLLAFSISNIIRALRFVFSNIKGIGYIRKLCVAGCVCTYLNTIDKLYRMHLKPLKVCVVLSAVHESMNILCQYYALKGTRVVGLSHGSNFVFEKDIPIDCVNYEDLHYECVVWSELTKREYMRAGRPENSLYVAGYPKQLEIKPVNQSDCMKRCLVLLCRKTYDTANEHLIDILKQFSDIICFHLKLHPTCDFDKYERISKKNGYEIIPKERLLSDCMDNNLFDFAIAVNTTSYYEIQIAGIPCLRYDDNGAFDMIPGYEKDRFDSKETLSTCIDWIKDCKVNGEYDKIRMQQLHDNLGVGIDRYREILLSF